MRKQKIRKIQDGGKPCPSCDMVTELREHIAISAKQLRQPFYYSRWYYCHNKDCRTTLIMPNEFKVENIWYSRQQRERQDFTMPAF